MFELIPQIQPTQILAATVPFSNYFSPHLSLSFPQLFVLGFSYASLLNRTCWSIISSSHLEVLYEDTIVEKFLKFPKKVCGGERTFLVPTTLLTIFTIVKDFKCKIKGFF